MDMTTILTPPWPRSLSDFVVACLSWDPRKRPTSVQCLNHEYFKEVERYLPLREMMPSITPTYTSNHSTSRFISKSSSRINSKTKFEGSWN
jgi:serine/threonine protein kinase